MVPEQRYDRRLARSAWKSATPRRPSRRVRCEDISQVQETVPDDENTSGTSCAPRSYRTYGTVLWRALSQALPCPLQPSTTGSVPNRDLQQQGESNSPTNPTLRQESVPNAKQTFGIAQQGFCPGVCPQPRWLAQIRRKSPTMGLSPTGIVPNRNHLAGSGNGL